MQKNVRYFLFNLIMDGINEGMKIKSSESNIANHQNMIARKIMNKHSINLEADWMLENQTFLDDVDNDLYSMDQIAYAMIHKGNMYVKAAPESISRERFKDILTSYEFDVNIALQERKIKESD